MAALPHPHALARIGPQEGRDLSENIFLGALTVDLVRAELPKCDASGACDPYVVLTMGNQTFKTKKQLKTRTPQWDLSFRFDVKSRNDLLHIDCFDWDRFTKNDLIGSADVPGKRFMPPSLKDLMVDIGRSRDDTDMSDELWLNLTKKGKRRGRILLRLNFDKPLTENDIMSKDAAESDGELENLDITIEDMDRDTAPAREQKPRNSLPSQSLFVETPATPRNSLARDEPEYEADLRPIGSKPVFDTTKVGELHMPADKDGSGTGRTSRVQSLSGVFAKLDDLERDEVLKPSLRKMHTAPIFPIPAQVSLPGLEKKAGVDHEKSQKLTHRELDGTETEIDEGAERIDLNLEVVGKAMQILKREGNSKTQKFPAPAENDPEKVRKELLSSLNGKLSAVRDGKKGSNTRRKRASSLLPAASDAKRPAHGSILNELQSSLLCDAKESSSADLATKDAALATLRSIKDAMATRLMPLLSSPYAAPAAGAILISVMVMWRMSARPGSHAPGGIAQ